MPTSASDVLKSREPFYADVWSAIGAIAWAIYIFLVTFSIGFGMDDRASYRILVAFPLVPQTAWPIIAAVLGVIQLRCTMQKATFPEWDNGQLWRCVMSFIMTVWWYFVFFAVIMAEWRSPAVPFYLLLGTMNLYNLGWLTRALRYGFR